MKRIWFKIRWYRWFWFDYCGCWPIRTLYCGPYRLDRASRRLIIERAEKESMQREPKL